MKITLDYPFAEYPFRKAFLVVSKYSQPKPIAGEVPWLPPYGRADEGGLEVAFVEQIKTEDGKKSVPDPVRKPILQRGHNFSVVFCGNPIGRSLTKDGKLADEIGPLISPFFYEDDQHTFFVEPSLTEITTREWEDYVIAESPPHIEWEEEDYWKDFPIHVEMPEIEQGGLIDPIDPLSRYRIQPKDDWVTNPTTVLRFDERLIGQGGGSDFQVLPAGTDVEGLGIPVNVSPGSDLAVDGVLVVSGPELGLDGGAVSGIELDVIGGGGLTEALPHNRDVLRAPGAAPVRGFVIR